MRDCIFSDPNLPTYVGFTRGLPHKAKCVPPVTSQQSKNRIGNKVYASRKEGRQKKPHLTLAKEKMGVLCTKGWRFGLVPATCGSDPIHVQQRANNSSRNRSTELQEENKQQTYRLVEEARGNTSRNRITSHDSRRAKSLEGPPWRRKRSRNHQ